MRLEQEGRIASELAIVPPASASQYQGYYLLVHEAQSQKRNEIEITFKWKEGRNKGRFLEEFIVGKKEVGRTKTEGRMKRQIENYNKEKDKRRD